MLNNYQIDTGDLYFIAEAGVNHEGNIEEAIKLVYAAKESNADAIKFTCYKTENYINKNETERFNRCKKFELGFDNFYKLARIAENIGIDFILTVLCKESLKVAKDLCDTIKISSGDIDNYELIKAVDATGKDIILSTGASKIDEVLAACKLISPLKLTLMHCVASYPCYTENANLNSIQYMQDYFVNIPIGYSDHTQSSKCCKIAYLLGARTIEKHFTLSREGKTFGDHAISATPKEIKNFLNGIEDLREILGLYDKKLWQCEFDKLNYLRRGDNGTRPRYANPKKHNN